MNTEYTVDYKGTEIKKPLQHNQFADAAMVTAAYVK
jgi:hypothetical protein